MPENSNHVTEPRSGIYRLLVGFEHLATGFVVQINYDALTTEERADPESVFTNMITWCLESPSVFRVECLVPILGYSYATKGIVYGNHVTDTQLADEAKERLFNKNALACPDTSAGEYEYYAKVVSKRLNGYEQPQLSAPAPKKVIRAIRAKHGENSDQILSILQYNRLSNYWYYTYNGTYFGVEPDGHIHT